jgi:hypothetical protein
MMLPERVPEQRAPLRPKWRVRAAPGPAASGPGRYCVLRLPAWRTPTRLPPVPLAPLSLLVTPDTPVPRPLRGAVAAGLISTLTPTLAAALATPWSASRTPSLRPRAYAAVSSFAMPGPAWGQIGGLQLQRSSSVKFSPARGAGFADFASATSTAPGSASTPNRRRGCDTRPTPPAWRPGSASARDPLVRR